METDKPKRFDPHRKIGGPVLLGVLTLGVFVVLFAVKEFNTPQYGDARRANNAKCASNLHQIGLAILLYQNDFGGKYPDSFARLIVCEKIPPTVFVCPASRDSPAAGQSSYVYIGGGLTDKTAADKRVVAYEPLGHHADGIHVLLGDGSAELIDPVRAQKVIDAASGPGPVLLPP